MPRLVAVLYGSSPAKSSCLQMLHGAIPLYRAWAQDIVLTAGVGMCSFIIGCIPQTSSLVYWEPRNTLKSGAYNFLKAYHYEM